LAATAAVNNWAHEHSIQVIHCLIDRTQSSFVSVGSSVSKASSKPWLPLLPAKKRLLSCEVWRAMAMAMSRSRMPGYVLALKSPGLPEFVRERGVASLVLAIVSTSGCLLRTTVTAGDEEFVVSVIEKA
ncbi:hypothetical protein BJ878DRAFT_392876, partial [Calycina marina]